MFNIVKGITIIEGHNQEPLDVPQFIFHAGVLQAFQLP